MSGAMDLDESMEEMQRAYVKYNEERDRHNTLLFVDEQYNVFDTVYRKMWAGLSPAYLSGSEWYFGDHLPEPIFKVFVLVCLLKTVCRNALSMGLLNNKRFARIAAAARTDEIGIDIIDTVD